MSSPWTIYCTIPPDAAIEAGELAGIASLTLFDSGALAIGETTESDGSVALTAGFDSEADCKAAHTALERQLPTVVAAMRRDTTHEQWILAQRAGLEPTTIGLWTIRAPWHDAPPRHEDRTGAAPSGDVVIDPGAAFGHGAHPSTTLSIELLLRALENHDPRQHTVVDMGTGTGVIAIVAALAGFRVRAAEFDADAAAVAGSNIETNAVAHLIDLFHGDALEVPVAPSDLVVANVTIDVHRHLAPTYAAADHLIVAGVLCRQVAAMRELLPNHRATTIRTTGEWAAIAFLRTNPH